MFPFRNPVANARVLRAFVFMEDSAVLGEALERPTKAKEGMLVEQIREPRSEVHSTGAQHHQAKEERPAA